MRSSGNAFVNTEKSMRHLSVRIMGTVQTATARAASAIQEQAPPFIRQSGGQAFLLVFISLMSLAQFIPFIFTRDISIAAAIHFDDKSVILCAGFTLGIIGFILLDLGYDVFVLKSFEMWATRSFYFTVTVTYALIIVYHPRCRDEYVHFGNFVLVAVFGRVLMDLCINDTTKTWTMARCMVSVSILAALNLLKFISVAAPLFLALPILLALTTACLTVASLRVIMHKHGEDSVLAATAKMSRSDVLIVAPSIIITLFVVILVLGPAAYSYPLFHASERLWQPSYVCADLIIRAMLMTTLATLPSVMQKYKVLALQSDLNLKGLFVKNVAHEIRTPLNIAVVGLEILKRSHAADPETVAMLEEVSDGCKVAVTILDDLLAYEKLSTGALKFDKSDVNVHELLRSCAALFDIQARGRDITLSVLENSNVVSRTAVVHADAGKITQVLRNFISNAIKFTPEGGLVSVVAFNGEESSGEEMLVIQIIDSGVGMTPAQLELIFKEIVQFDVNSLQKGGGSGIGLWVCKKLVDVHGGKVKVMSKGKGCGCVFELQLPMAPAPPPSASSQLLRIHPTPDAASQQLISPVAKESLRSIQEEAKRKSNVAIGRHFVSQASSRRLNINGESERSLRQVSDRRTPGLGLGLCLSEEIDETRDVLQGLHALLVDDSKMNRKLVSRLLQFACSVVDEAEDGEQCIAKINQNNVLYDFILMDKHMPVKDGLEATRALRAQNYSGLIIGVTGDAQQDDIVEFIESGANDCLVKPVTYEQIQSCVALHLHKASLSAGGLPRRAEPSECDSSESKDRLSPPPFLSRKSSTATAPVPLAKHDTFVGVSESALANSGA